MSTTVTLKSTVTRRQPVLEPVDADERAAQLQHHQSAENATLTANKAATAMQATEAVPKYRVDPQALQSAFMGGNLGKQFTVFLVNGIKLVGRLRQFDQFTVLLENNGEQLLVFKHAISTVIPTMR